MRLPPDAHFLSTFVAQKHSPAAIASEMIDNAFDPAAGDADGITITLGSEYIEFHDDGRGVEELNRLAILGRSGSASDENSIGQYGRGSKLWISWGEQFAVETVHEGRLHKFVFDAGEAIRNNDWMDGYPPDKKGRKTNKDSYTKLTMLNRWDKTTSIRFNDLCDALTKRYWLALKRGKRITVRDWRKKNDRKEVVLEVMSPPDLTHRIEVSGDIGGKQYRGYVGILEDKINAYGGVFASYLYRNIKHFKGVLGGRRLPPRVHGRIELIGDWKLTDVKDGFKEEEALADALFEQIEPIAKKADKLDNVIKLDALVDWANQRLPDFAKENIELMTATVDDSPGQDDNVVSFKKPSKPGDSESDQNRAAEEMPDFERPQRPVTPGDSGYAPKPRPHRFVELQHEPLGNDCLSTVAVMPEVIVVTLNSDAASVRAIGAKGDSYPFTYILIGQALAREVFEYELADAHEKFRGCHLGESIQSIKQLSEEIMHYWGNLPHKENLDVA